MSRFLLELERELEAAARRRIEPQRRRRAVRPRLRAPRLSLVSLVIAAALAAGTLVLGVSIAPRDRERTVQPPPAAPNVVLVLNATPDAGRAREALRRLERRGYSGRIGSWTSQDEPRSTVLHAPGRATDARRIASALGIGEVRAGVPPDVVAPETARPDVVVVLGARP